MVINYVDLFEEDISEVVSAIESVESFAGSLETKRVSMIESFDDNGCEELVPQIEQLFNGIQSTLNSFSNAFVSIIQLRITHRETIVEQLPGVTSDTDFQQVVLALIADMKINSKAVIDSIVTLGAITKTTVNANSGNLVRTQIHPGGTHSPGSGFISNRFLVEEKTQMTLDDTITVQCTSGIGTGSSPGSESFIVTGLSPKQQEPFEFNQGGNRSTLSLSVDQSPIVNPWTSFNNSLPSGWVHRSGVAGTDYGKELVKTLFDKATLFLDNDAEIRYDIYSSLSPGQICYLYFYAQRVSGVTGTIKADIHINGISSLILNVNTTTLSDSSWTLNSVEFIVPDDIGINDISLTYLSLSCITLSGFVYIGHFHILPFQYYSGVGMVITRGLQPFLLDDNFKFTTLNNDAGPIQRVFTRALGVQLPGQIANNVGTGIPIVVVAHWSVPYPTAVGVIVGNGVVVPVVVVWSVVVPTVTTLGLGFGDANPVSALWSVPTAAGSALGPGTGIANPVSALWSVIGSSVSALGPGTGIPLGPVTSNWSVVTATANGVTSGTGVVSPVAANWSVPVVSTAGSIGPELITNGTFDTDSTGWLLSNMIWEVAHIEKDFGGIPCWARHEDYTWTADGFTYRFTFNIANRTGDPGSCIMKIGTTTKKIFNTNGSQSVDVVMNVSGKVEFEGILNSSGFHLDNVSAKRIY